MLAVGLWRAPLLVPLLCAALPLLSVSKLPKRCTYNQQEHSLADVHRLGRATHKGWVRYRKSPGMPTWLAMRTAHRLTGGVHHPGFRCKRSSPTKNYILPFMVL